MIIDYETELYGIFRDIKFFFWVFLRDEYREEWEEAKVT